MSEELEVRYRRARAWLARVRSSAEAIEPLVREIAALEDARTRTLPWQTRSGGGGGGSIGAHSDPTASEAERRMASLDTLIASKRHELDVLTDTVGECGAALDRMRHTMGERHAQAIELYYIDRADTWSEVASEMDVSYRHLGRLRNQAYAWIEVHCRKFLV